MHCRYDRPATSCQISEHLHYRGLVGEVQIRRWLIQEHHWRLLSQCHGNGDPLPLASRKTVHWPVEHLVSVRDSHGFYCD